jgi:glyoxylase-like metal-dependent hydrolase (beta-lactamase superfamily II)
VTAVEPLLLAILLAAPALAATPAPVPTPGPAPATVALANGVQLVPGAFRPGVQPDGNTVVLRGTDGLVVVDTGRHEAHARAVLEVARASGLPVSFVVNTHWHLDHVSGNPRVRLAHPGLKVLSSDAIDEALRGFLAGYRSQLEGLAARAEDEAARTTFREEIARIDSGRALAPDLVVASRGARTLAGRRLEIGVERHAATAGDVWVLDEASGVLAAGDLVTLPVPLLDTACPAGWREALSNLSSVPFRVLVPGHGHPMGREDFEAWRTAFGRLLDCAATGATDAACSEGWIRDLGPLLPEADRPFARTLLAYYVPELLRAPPEQRRRWCGPSAPPSVPNVR